MYSVKFAVRKERIYFNRKILPSFTAARARSSNRKQNFNEDDVTGGTFLRLGRTFFVGNIRKRSVFTHFRTFLNFFGQNEWHICFSQPILR